MFSNLGPLFKAEFRQAEHTDTRQAIRREEKEHRRKDDESNRQDQDDTFWEDSTAVSVDALRTFLINFLKGTTLTDKIRQKTEGSENIDIRTPEQRLPANTHTARALGAYQSMAEKLGQSEPSPPAEDPALISEADLVQSDEVRLMHRLITDLETLSNQGVETLTIERADSFLQSLENAVNLVKGR